MSSKGKEPMDLSDLSDLELDPDLSANVLASCIEDRLSLANELYSRLQDLAMQQVNLVEEISPNLRKRLELLLEIQGKYDEHKKEFLKERAALDAKYQKIYEALYAMRYEIVNGIMEVEGVSNEAKGKAPAEDNAYKGVHGFWLTAMKNNKVLAKEIQKRDEEALEFLKDIKWCKTDEPRGFKLDFFFDTNPYLKNSILTKTYQMIDEDDRHLQKIFGTEIEWHPGKCLSQKTLKKRPKKGSIHAIPIKKIEKCRSFFKFFDPPEIPADYAELGDEAQKKLQNPIQQDFNIAATFRDKIIPRAVLWFIGEAGRKAYFTDFDDENEDEDADEDDEKEDKR